MPEDKEVELSEDDKALENMENTLEEIHGDRSFDDVDAQDDTSEITENLTDDQEEEADEKESGEQQSTEGDPEKDGEEESPKGEEEAEGEAVSDEDDAGKDDLDAGDEPEVDDDKLMEGMKAGTKERFEHFRTENKRLNEEFEAQGAEYSTLRESTEAMNYYINDSQISPEQLSTALSLAKAINTGDMDMAREAFPRMQAMMNHVAIGLGDASANVDLTPELKQSQDNLDITPDLARQQALHQAQNTQRQQYQQQAYQQDQYQQQQQQQANQQQNDDHASANTAASDIKEWENGLVASDPDFGAKRKQMLINSEQIMRENHPTRWLSELQKEYNTISTTMTSMAEARTRQNAKNQGIRPGAGSGAGTGESEPKSFEDNFSKTLNNMRRNTG